MMLMLLQDPIFESEPLAGAAEPYAFTAMGFLNRYALLFLAAFVVTLLVTPLVRRAAISADVIDHPDDERKAHGQPVAYLGGLAVFIGLMAAIALSYTPWGGARSDYAPIPFSIVLGVVAITATGLMDDIWGFHPRLKIAGQLVAAAALALNQVGIRVAEGLLAAFIGNADVVITQFDLFGDPWVITNADIFYWVGTAVIAVFVIGGCNAANLIDGLDGLLSGTIGIIMVALLSISIIWAIHRGEPTDPTDSTLAGARIALSLAVLGAVLGFLPHNFNPATIFLGDCGSLLLGYLSVVIILMLGDEGRTHLVVAGLIVFAVPILDTALAMARRKLAGRAMAEADDQHIHHQLLRALGGVKRAVFALYGISILFGLVGVLAAWLVIRWELRLAVIYAIAIVLFGFIGVIALKAARRAELNAETDAIMKRKAIARSRTAESKAGATASSELAAPSSPASTRPAAERGSSPA